MRSAKFNIGDLVLIERNCFDRNEDEIGLVMWISDRKLLPGQNRIYRVLVRSHMEALFEHEIVLLSTCKL